MSHQTGKKGRNLQKQTCVMVSRGIIRDVDWQATYCGAQYNYTWREQARLALDGKKKVETVKGPRTKLPQMESDEIRGNRQEGGGGHWGGSHHTKTPEKIEESQKEMWTKGNREKVKALAWEGTRLSVGKQVLWFANGVSYGFAKEFWVGNAGEGGTRYDCFKKLSG